VRVGEASTLRLHLRNTGTWAWLRRANHGSGRVGLCVSLDGRRCATVPLRQDVWPGGQCHFAFSLSVKTPGAHELVLELEDETGGFSRHGVPPLRARVEAEGSATSPRAWLRSALRAIRGS
jgi:hypothetical protein